jgi:hypothetical protein
MTPDVYEVLNRWRATITRPDWYLSIVPEYNQYRQQLKELPNEAQESLKEQLYDFFEQALQQETIPLGVTGKNFDAERKPVDSVVIHHTINRPGLTAERLSAIELIRLYAAYYADPPEEDSGIKGMPIYSGHVRHGRQYFGVYHWIVRTDGSVERLLNDNETGWQAGNWDINCRSIAIVFDNDYEVSCPPKVEIEAAARIIREYYHTVSKDRVFGHCEIIPGKSVCPSTLFLDSESRRGWKQDLIALI